ncbi:DUF3098 domain-containing protein [uncultured Apibacter sp.]|uniref:DUF3098 domain-containing protein n=1 Tax=uncultured Apibacter sp. TaxID=1778616 RepID=UPI0025F93EE1|nr:DUF3098 domain-containing protein [uncultured Apibacter sp.]
MKDNLIKNNYSKSEKPFLFGKRNYIFMLIGLGLIALGLILMTGPDANTVDGVFDKNNWNEEIFSFRRIRLAPICIVLGFIVEIYSIMTYSNPKKIK